MGRGMRNVGAKLWLGIGLSAFALSVATLPAVAAPASGGVITLLDENDTYVNTDRYYTNGVKFGYVMPPAHTDALGTWLSKHVWPGAEGLSFRNSYSFGQSMFTPSNLTISASQPDDRPYAGWLYGDYGLIAEGKNAVTTADVELGVVGPAAGGKRLQINLHQILKGTSPNGWNNQVENQPGIDLTVTRQWRQQDPLEWQGVQLEIEPHIGATAGSVMTEAFAGGSLVIGNALVKESLPLRVRPGFGGAGSYDDVSGVGWFLFAGASGRAIAYDATLEGKTPYKSLIDRRPYVLDMQVGAALRLWHAQFTFTIVERTKEFSAQAGNHRFGSLSLSWHL